MPFSMRTLVLVVCLLGTGYWLLSSNRQDTAGSQPSPWVLKGNSDIRNETLGFQNVFVVNLPSRSDRRDAMALAGSLTGLKFDWIDGVAGEQVSEKALPADGHDKTISKGNIGSWRAHMNVLRRIIEQDITSALILEDDIDWDIRLKAQLQNFSLASRGYLQPLTSNPSSTLSATAQNTVSVTSLPKTLPPHTSPYGDNWDVLWLGHCGTDFPTPNHPLPLPLLRIEINDATVPSPSHLRPHPFASLDEPLIADHPPHTRVIHAAGAGIACTQGYAVSRHGAAKLLWRFGTQTFTTGWDLMLRDWCGGVYDRDVPDGKKEKPVCVTVQPPLFVQHYGKGSASDITAPGGGFINREKEMTPYVRLSVRLNMGALVRGDKVEDLVDQWPD